MSARIQAIQDLVGLLGAREAAEIFHMSSLATRVEAQMKTAFHSYIRQKTKDALALAEETGRLRLADVDFEPLVMTLTFRAMRAGLESAQPKSQRGGPLASLAAGKERLPRTLRELRVWWDKYRQGKKVPKHQRAVAAKLKKAYVDKLQAVWVKHGEDFRAGNTASKGKVVAEVMKGADVVYSRAKMVVETETTSFYNQSRRGVYDQSQDVTHYLFLAIRDHATTDWCKTRHGLVYAKGDPILDKETPAIHWNCRSDLVPLTPINPRHRKLIEDKRLWRRNNKCKPLPPGWTRR